MKQFQLREIMQAIAYANDGGQALHMMPEYFAHLRRDTPAIFKEGGEIAHLFDRNVDRLVSTARRLGVRVIKVERGGTERQHIDLCRGPLLAAIKQCEAEAKLEQEETLPLAVGP